MKKSLSAALILLAIVYIAAIGATTISFAADMADVVPEVPQNFAAVNSATGVSITWEQTADTAGYKIYRQEGSEEPEEIADIRGYEQVSYTDTSVKSGKEYKYTIKAYNAFNEGAFSEKSTIVYLSRPTITKAGSVYGGIELTWEKSKGADGYTIYKKRNGKYEEYKKIKGYKTCSFLDKKVKNNEKYEYAVVAHKDIYTSALANKTSKVYITAPRLGKTKNFNGYVKVYWSKTKTADKYRVYRKTSKTDWVYLDTVSSKYSTFKDKTVKNDRKYIYTVRAIDGKYNSGYNRKGVTAKYVSAPKNVSLKNYYSDTIKVTWNKVGDAEKYIVYRKDTKNPDWIKVKETSSREYKDSKIVNGRKYTYSVKVKGENGGISGYSKIVKLTALKRPDEIKLYGTTKGVKITWTKMTSGTGYAIYRKTKGSSEWDLIKKIKNDSTTSYTDTRVKEGKAYYYRVLQIKGSTNGSCLKNGVKIKYGNIPEISAKHSPKGIVLSWNKAKSGEGYKIQRKTEGQKEWKTISTVRSSKTCKYTDSKPAFGKKNYYRVIVKGVNLISDSCSIYGINPKKKMVALTYDDGPYTPVTNQILDVLEENNGRATFFVVGSRVPSYKKCIKRAFSLDCEIGNHTYNHTILTSVGASTIKSEISKTSKEIKKITGQAPKIVRTPGGAVNSTVKENINYPIFNWSVDTLDWKYRSSDHIISAIKNNVSDGSIVLMHDLYESTGNASEEIIPWLVEKGYQLVTVSELMAVKGIDVEKGQLYNNAY